jgi:negative regulator of flagellin synthesis FlgM
MKISTTPPSYINQTYANQAGNAAGQNLKSQKSAEESVIEAKSDSINLSERTRDLQKISMAMDTDPMDRKKYVADIKQKVENNQYNLNAETVAERMVGSLMDKFG